MALFDELKRRNVFRVGLAYLAAAWLLIQIADTIFPVFGFPNAVRIVVIVFAIGFVPALVFAWAFEWTPEGIKRDEEVDSTAPARLRRRKTFDRIIMVVLALAVVYFGFDKFILQPAREAERIAAQFDRSIAVMPFSDLSPDQDQSYLSDGIAEDLLNLLGRIDGLRVISRRSAFALRDENLSLPQIAERLGVAYILEGSVRKSSERVRIGAQLIHAATDTQVWEDSYERTLNDVFGIQEEISQQVVSQLRLRILDAPALPGSTDPAAYSLYLRGRSLLARREDMQQVIEIFEQVIDLDPAYAPAHASLALALVWSDDANRNERAIAAAEAALDIDAENSDALAALGRILYEMGNVAQAKEMLNRAISSNPNNAMAHRWLGIAHGVNDPPRYYSLVRTAAEIDPLDLTIYFHLATSLSRLGRYDEAFLAAKRLEPPAVDLAGDIYRFSGRLDAALKSYYRTYREDSAQFGTVRYISRILLELGEAELAEIWMQELRESARDAMASDAELAFVRGNSEQAMQIFNDAHERDGLPDIWLAFGQLVYGRDFAAARDSYESGLTRAGQQVPEFDPDGWIFYLHYALTLQKTGDGYRATALIDAVRNIVESQLAAGTVIGPYNMPMAFHLAQLESMSGNTQAAVDALRLAIDEGGFTCTFCVRLIPHFDNLRGNAQAESLLYELDSRNAATRLKLDSQGLLLTPEKLKQLASFDYDPFEDVESAPR